MRTVSCVLGVSGSEGSSSVIPFTAGEGTLQLTSVAVRCHFAPPKKTNDDHPDDKKKPYVPHKKRDAMKKLLVRVLIHVRGPADAEERSYCIATVPLRPRLAGGDSDAIVSAPVDVCTTSKLDLRFQMETARVSAEVYRVGYWNLQHNDFNGQVAVMGTCSLIE